MWRGGSTACEPFDVDAGWSRSEVRAAAAGSLAPRLSLHLKRTSMILSSTGFVQSMVNLDVFFLAALAAALRGAAAGMVF